MTAPRKFVPPRPEVVEQLHAEADRQLTPAEIEAFLNTPLSSEERAQMEELIDWFLRRYPTPRERLRYGRKWTLRLRKALPEGATRRS